ncbi:MAG: TonB-dependent receptor domain-containing protein, partial [Armatimonadota bacterium]
MLIPSAVAFADGQVRFKVLNARNREPLPGAVVKIEPSASEIDELQFTTASNGSVETGDIAPGSRNFEITAIVNGLVFKKFKGKITVVDNQVAEVEVLLEEQGFDKVDITTQVLRINLDDLSQSTFRDRKFFDFYPLATGNRQSLSKSLRSVPGFASDSVNQTHGRGGQSNLAFAVDGFLLPIGTVASALPAVTPDAIETLRARSGGFGAWYGGVGPLVDIGLRPSISGDPKDPLEPVISWRLGSGDFGTRDGSLILSKQRGVVKDRKGDIGYFLSLSDRRSSNVFESPQPGRQTSGNTGDSDTIFGKIEAQLRPGVEFASFFHTGSAISGIANRTGLGTAFPTRPGYGFGGFSPESAFTPVGGTPITQDSVGQRIFQKDNSRWFVNQIRQRFSPKVSGVLSAGFVQNVQSLVHNTTQIRLQELPANGPVEYLPATRQDYRHSQFQGDFTIDRAAGHVTKAGFLVRNTDGGESLFLLPQSTTAAGALTNFSPYFTGALDATVLPNTERVPVLMVDRAVQYGAFYLQDAWKLRPTIRVEAGLRAESYKTNEQYFPGNPVRPRLAQSNRSDSAVSPRLNLLLEVPRGFGLGFGKTRLRLGSAQPTALRVSYNGLFASPFQQGNFGLGQTGATIASLAPQKGSQVDISLERQLRRQNVKIGWYDRSLRNASGYRQLIDGPQMSMYSAVDLGRLDASGMEFSWEYDPRDFSPRTGRLTDLKGFTAFVVANSGKVRAGTISPGFDQRTTVAGGVGYTAKGGDAVSLSLQRGSGFASSVVGATGGRQAVTELNLRVASGPSRFRGLGVELGVENLADSRGIVDF